MVTLAAISVNRYIMICHSQKYKVNDRGQRASPANQATVRFGAPDRPIVQFGGLACFL